MNWQLFSKNCQIRDWRDDSTFKVTHFSRRSLGYCRSRKEGLIADRARESKDEQLNHRTERKGTQITGSGKYSDFKFNRKEVERS